MKDLLICVLATAWVLLVVRYMGTRRHRRETPDHIDRDFREMIARFTPDPVDIVGDRPERFKTWHTPCDMVVGECDICEVIPDVTR